MRGQLLFGWALGACFWATIGCAPEPAAGPPTTALVGAKLIDGTDAEPFNDSVILVQGQRVVAAGRRSTVAIPPNAEIIDVAGKTIIPGLIDLHVHYAPEPAEMPRILGSQLAFGVTAVRSIGTDDAPRLEVLRQANAGDFPAPNVWSAGLGFSAPGGHPIVQESIYRPLTPEEAQGAVRELAAQRVDFVKMWVDSKYETLPKISLGMREAIVDEAVEVGLPVVAHIFDKTDVLHLAEQGVTDFLHTVRNEEPGDPAFVDYCLSKQLWFTPTLTVIQSNWLFLRDPGKLEDDPEAKAGMTADTLAELRDTDWRAEKLAAAPLHILEPELELAQRFTARMHRAGVWIALGSDSNGALIPAGWGTHNELELLVDAGLSPRDAILAGTARAAMRLGTTGERGSLVPGYRADLIVLDADPLEDIKNTRKISRVMFGGQWVDRERLLALP